MSMYYSANKIFGLLLTDDEIENFKKNYCIHNKEQLLNEFKDDLEPDDLKDDNSIINALMKLTDESFMFNEDLYATEGDESTYFTSFFIDYEQASGMCFYPLTMVENREQAPKEIGEGLIIPAEKGCSEISILAKDPFYNSVDEVIEEFKTKFAPLLPEDFDYMTHIGEFWFAFFA